MSEREGLDWDMDGETGNQVRAYLSRISSFTKDEASQALAYVRHLESEYNGAIADCGTAEDNAKAALNRAATAEAQVAERDAIIGTDPADTRRKQFEAIQGLRAQVERQREALEVIADIRYGDKTRGDYATLIRDLARNALSSETSTPQEPR